MLLGVIADDFTGATDIAGFLVENGMRTIQLNGIPTGDFEVAADAVVISLKSRSCPAFNHVLAPLMKLLPTPLPGLNGYKHKAANSFTSNIAPLSTARLRAILGLSLMRF